VDQKPETRSLESGALLLQSAFEAARDQGREDWQTMTAAVLKNRMLGLTDRGFDERDWGASSFRGFLALFSNLIDVDGSTKPAIVRWIGAPEGDPAPAVAGARFELGPRRRIRDDLWTAVLDYTSGQAYLWDGHGAVAIPREAAEPGARMLPTLTREEFGAWRAEFVEQAVAENPMAEGSLQRWRETEAGTAALPRPLRSVWIGELKGRVLSRLLEWFDGQGIDPPSDLVVDAPPHRGQDRPTEQLRELILDCVAVMTRAQLEELRLPPDAVLRARSG
jgi:hypothetical protein